MTIVVKPTPRPARNVLTFSRKQPLTNQKEFFGRHKRRSWPHQPNAQFTLFLVGGSDDARVASTIEDSNDEERLFIRCIGN